MHILYKGFEKRVSIKKLKFHNYPQHLKSDRLKGFSVIYMGSPAPDQSLMSKATIMSPAHVYFPALDHRIRARKCSRQLKLFCLQDLQRLLLWDFTFLPAATNTYCLWRPFTLRLLFRSPQTQPFITGRSWSRTRITLAGKDVRLPESDILWTPRKKYE